MCTVLNIGARNHCERHHGNMTVVRVFVRCPSNYCIRGGNPAHCPCEHCEVGVHFPEAEYTIEAECGTCATARAFGLVISVAALAIAAALVLDFSRRL